jgi:pimeloyl-ACP methyl ester carboxylesterase
MKIFILLGGFVGPDGWVTSAGMLGLKAQLQAAFPQAEVSATTWDRYNDTYIAIRSIPAEEKVALIGYSGGGSRATWLANIVPRVTIDLMVLYDPSPSWQMKDINGTKVKKCLQYYNTTPLFFGLGSGKADGPQVTTVNISMQHILVQTSQSLHKRTIEAIKAI